MLQKVIDYKIVESDTPQALVSKIRASIDDGWVPSGALIAEDGYMQVMVRFSGS
ncbi:MAG: hypothetical protein JWO41_230 [Candidatus Saccharibacteria bacterium]|nr:hypothetical protein [Candidatus Saccharibacteria bacterium]